MERQTYLLRKNGRYHFQRRFAFGGDNRQPIMLALGTADPGDARRIANRQAVKWDAISVQVAQRIEQGTLTLEDSERCSAKVLSRNLPALRVT